jgi:hypothetical protein
MIGPGRGARWWVRRVVFTLVVVAQLTLVVRAYHAPQRPFGFQMFPESSDWRADIVRVTADGERRPIDDGTWEYRWSELVRTHGLGRPEVRHHASAGLDSTLHLFGAALDWVAANTPRDERTLYLEATVTTWHNGRAPRTIVLRSDERVTGPTTASTTATGPTR